MHLEKFSRLFSDVFAIRVNLQAKESIDEGIRINSVISTKSFLFIRHSDFALAFPGTPRTRQRAPVSSLRYFTVIRVPTVYNETLE